MTLPCFASLSLFILVVLSYGDDLPTPWHALLRDLHVFTASLRDLTAFRAIFLLQTVKHLHS
ncbi:hypothetical protein ASPFODRAFT_518989 [Aspergillus luchuensis CBS 106.47]|uniref:Uncharacterized protein n=1 Tax=Aspergillus luchuensis (strain CBS 106.47) TaxID=1137211 RepID=A0A1M3SZF6_ASPLC|nr:hypothetical protein ASPFODRAFT_518989 [Aspergillus luchuensis CBS 106.47]